MLAKQASCKQDTYCGAVYQYQVEMQFQHIPDSHGSRLRRAAPSLPRAALTSPLDADAIPFTDVPVRPRRHPWVVESNTSR
jgi:hypothetical protein